MNIVMKKFFPEANNWMWDYCKYLGSSVYNGNEKLDLGVHIPSADKGCVSFAIVYGPEGGQYASGPIYMDGKFQPNWLRIFRRKDFQDHWDTYKLAKAAGVFNDFSFVIEDENHLSRLFERPEDSHLLLTDTHNFLVYCQGKQIQGFIYNFIGFLGFQDKDGARLKYDYYEIVPKQVLNEQGNIPTPG